MSTINKLQQAFSLLVASGNQTWPFPVAIYKWCTIHCDLWWPESSDFFGITLWWSNIGMDNPQINLDLMVSQGSSLKYRHFSIAMLDHWSVSTAIRHWGAPPGEELRSGWFRMSHQGCFISFTTIKWNMSFSRLRSSENILSRCS